MKSYLLVGLFAGFFSFFLSAQPINNTCIDASELTDLNNNCSVHSFADATFQLRNGSCAPAFARNVWFRFTAQGTDLEISIATQNGPEAYITVYEMEAPICSPNTSFQLACDTNELAVANILEVGEEYHVNISFPINYQQSFTLCIDNPEINIDPPNDYRCFPQPVNFDGCVEGTTQNATFDFNNTFCPFADIHSVWYSGRLSSGKNTLEVQVSNLETDSDVAIMLGTFPNNDCIQSFDAIDGFCFDSTGLAVFNNLAPGRLYYIMLSHPDGNAQDFELCFEEKGPSGGCAVNNLCTAPEIINLVTDDGEICLPGCNRQASFGPTNFGPNCYFMNSPTVWYEFQTDEVAGFLRVKVTSDTLRFPKVAVFRGTDCGNLDTVRCERGNNRELEFFMQVIPNTTYKLALTDISQDQGIFEICTELISDPQECNQDDTLYAISTSFGSPLEGPYQPGETVTFQYELKYWNKDNCNKISAIIPTFGPGWDPSSFDDERAPAIIAEPRPVSSGRWNWYPRGTVRYNYDNPDKGYLKGTPISAGWLFVSSSSPPNDPGNSTGDGVTCMNDSTETWSASFSVRAFSNQDCPNGNFVPADVGVITFGDGEIAAGEFRGCSLDEPLNLNTQVFCCEPLPFSISPTLRRLCSGENAFIDFSNNSGIEEVFWRVTSNQGLVRPADGRGQVFNQDLFLIPGVPAGETTITFFPRDTAGCVGESVDVTFEVYLQVDAEAGTDITACAGELVELGGNPTAGGGTGSNYQYVWTGSTPNIANPTVIVEEGTTVYRLRVIDQLANCSETDTVVVTGLSLPNFQLLPIEEVCSGQEGEISLEFSGAPPYSWSLQAGNFLDEQFSNYTDDTFTTSFNQTQSFDVTARLISDDNCTVNLVSVDRAVVTPPVDTSQQLVLCAGESVEIDGLVYDRSGTYEIFLPNSDPEECNQLLTLDLSILSELVIQRRNIGEDGPNGAFIKVVIAGGLPPYQYDWSNGETTDSIFNLSTGEYQLTVTDANDCIAEFSFMVTSTSSENPTKQTLLTFPNPVGIGEPVMVKIRESESPRVFAEWLDATGREQGRRLFDNSGQFTLPSPSSSGLFILRITDEEGRIIGQEKVIVIE